MQRETVATAKARFDRICAMEDNASAQSHAAAIAYSLDIPALLTAIDKLTAETAALKQKADVWTAQAAIWRTGNVTIVNKLIQSTSSYEDRIDELTRDLNDAVDAHIKITAAMRCGGRTPEKALDTMLRIRQKLGRDK